MGESIYRLRPANETSVDEIENSYLWFSRPTEFKDNEDSNITVFIKKNKSIKDSFDRIFTGHPDVAKQAKKIGICCFTGSIPPFHKWGKFPKAKNGICIEYDKDLLIQFFANNMGIGNCFKQIDYQKEPLTFKTSENEHIIWEVKNGGYLYKSMREIEKNPKLRDKLFLKMFTRLKIKHKKQNEYRIILGGSNIPDLGKDIKGYRVNIPKAAMQEVHIHPEAPENIKQAIEKWRNSDDIDPHK